MDEQGALNALQLAGQEALAYANAHDEAFSRGGKLVQEEIEKGEQAAAARQDDPGTTEGTTPLEKPEPKAPSTDDPWTLLAEGAGKWKDAEEAKKGYFHALNLAKNALAERDALQQRLTSEKPVHMEQTAANEVDALKALEEYGVPSEVIGKAIDQRAQQTLMAILQPMANQLEAENYMTAQYGEAWTKNKPEVELFIQSDPAVRARVESARAKGEFTLANEYAMLRYAQAKGAETEGALKANNEVRKELVEQARKDAGIVGATRSEGRDKEIKPEGMTPERFNQLVGRYKAGYEAPLWRETIGATLPKELFE